MLLDRLLRPRHPLLRKMIVRLEADGQPVFRERDAAKLIADLVLKLSDSPKEEQLEFVLQALPEMQATQLLGCRLGLKVALTTALRNDLRLSSTDALRLVELVSVPQAAQPYRAVLNAIAGQPVTPDLCAALGQLRDTIHGWVSTSEARELSARIDEMLHGHNEHALVSTSGWSGRVLQDIVGEREAAWRALLQHGTSLRQSVPGKKWLAEASVKIDEVGRAEVQERARSWLALGPMPDAPGIPMPDEEADFQKGFLFTLVALGEPSLCSLIGDFACACLKKIPNVGAVSHRVGNACVNVLASLPGLEPVAQLSRLAARVKYDVARRLIEKALAEAAERNGVSREDLEAMAVPTFGLEEGVRVERSDDSEARLSIVGGHADLTWLKSGKVVKNVPTNWKATDPALVRDLKNSAKDLDVTLSTLRVRLERLFLAPQPSRFEQWQASYLNHPVTSHFAKRLIWSIDGRPAIWFEGRLVDWSGVEVPTPSNATVRLWHPITADVQTVLSWRCWLEDQGVRQPFKQAHREVYLLTDAERNTSTYSNRFAAHLLRQHQFAALCRERGWQFHLMGAWDSHNVPYLDLPSYGLRAEFHVDAGNGTQDLSGHSIYLVIGTDRVQFRRADIRPHWEIPRGGIPLEEVPPLLFSEVMRDVDLFVGVTSIGADPAWDPAREQPHTHEYWQRVAFGELSGAAENRRTILEALLPRLAIAKQCRLEGRFLIVRGKLHEYRIHLGSGNVLMEPGSRYLCIVQGPGDSTASLRLPFDGDRTLSLILSKAMLLAEDTRIKDETIRQQIR